MKIIQINTICGKGSTGRITRDIADWLNQNGHECLIAFGRDQSINCSYSFKFSNKIDNIIHAFRNRLTDKHGLYSKNVTNKLIKRIIQFNPDVIQLHNIHGYYLNYEILFNFLKKYNKRVIWTLHDCWAFTGHCAYFDRVNCDKWKTGCYQCPQKRNYPKSILIDNSKNNYNKKKLAFSIIPDLTIVTPSVWLKNLVKESFLKEYEVKVINNGIDTQNFKPIYSDFKKENGLQNKKIILGVANSWGERKGFKDFIELSKLINNEYIIILIGLNSKQIKTLPKNIIGFEKTNNIKQLSEIYTAADILFNPTYEDNYPTVNIEALLCGTPVVCYKTGGAFEMLNENRGVIVEKGNLEASLNAIKKIDKSFLTENRDSLIKSFDKSVMVKNYINIYEKV